MFEEINRKVRERFELQKEDVAFEPEEKPEELEHVDEE